MDSSKMLAVVSIQIIASANNINDAWYLHSISIQQIIDSASIIHLDEQ